MLLSGDFSEEWDIQTKLSSTGKRAAENGDAAACDELAMYYEHSIKITQQPCISVRRLTGIKEWNKNPAK